MNDEELAEAGLDAVDNFIEGFNSRDPDRWVESLNFPHIRTTPGADNHIIEDAETYVAAVDYQPIINSGWDHSAWDYKHIIHVSEHKIHVAGQWSRFNRENELIMSTPVVYVVTCMDGKWGIQARFAVDFVAENDLGETQRPAFKIIEAFVQGFNNKNMRSCATLLHYPHVDIRPGQIIHLTDSASFSLESRGTMQIDSLIAVQSGNLAVNLAVESTVVDNTGIPKTYQGMIQVTQKNDHPGINAWSVI
jgi:hypothetical protein